MKTARNHGTAVWVVVLSAGLVVVGCRMDPAKALAEQIETALSEPNVTWDADYRRQYVDTIRRAMAVGDLLGEAQAGKLHILRTSLATYCLAAARTHSTPARFEVQKSTVRWYIESLLAVPMPSVEDRTLLESQFRELCDYAASHLEGQFPSFDQRQVLFPTALTQGLCYRSSVVASVECYQKLEAHDGQENQFTDEEGVAGCIAAAVSRVGESGQGKDT